MSLNSVELTDTVEDFGRLVALVEETGERVTLTEDGRRVLLPGAELAELEHWAQRVLGGGGRVAPCRVA